MVHRPSWLLVLQSRVVPMGPGAVHHHVQPSSGLWALRGLIVWDQPPKSGLWANKRLGRSGHCHISKYVYRKKKREEQGQPLWGLPGAAQIPEMSPTPSEGSAMGAQQERKGCLAQAAKLSPCLTPRDTQTFCATMSRPCPREAASKAGGVQLGGVSIQAIPEQGRP